MSYEEFWRGDPWLAKYYREAYIERRKEENRRDWIQGAYFFNAVSVAINNAFREKGKRAANYLEEPLPIFPPTKEEKEAKRRAENAKMMAALMGMQKKQRAENARRRQNASTNNPGTGNQTVDEGSGRKD